MSSKKSGKSGSGTKSVKASAPKAKKKIVSLAEYEAQAKAETQPTDDVAATVAAVEKGNLAEGVMVPVGKKRQPKADKPAKEHKPSGLDAAVRVLREAGVPMNTADMVKTMLEKGYWSTGGKTPAATIYAGIITEIAKKGDKSRFRKVDRGQFELTGSATEVK